MTVLGGGVVIGFSEAAGFTDFLGRREIARNQEARRLLELLGIDTVMTPSEIGEALYVATFKTKQAYYDLGNPLSTYPALDGQQVRVYVHPDGEPRLETPFRANIFQTIPTVNYQVRVERLNNRGRAQKNLILYGDPDRIQAILKQRPLLSKYIEEQFGFVDGGEQFPQHNFHLNLVEPANVNYGKVIDPQSQMETTVLPGHVAFARSGMKNGRLHSLDIGLRAIPAYHMMESWGMGERTYWQYGANEATNLIAQIHRVTVRRQFEPMRGNEGPSTVVSIASMLAYEVAKRFNGGKAFVDFYHLLREETSKYVRKRK